MDQPSIYRQNRTAIFLVSILGIFLSMSWQCSPNKEQRMINARAAYTKAESFYNAGHFRDAVDAFTDVASMYEEIINDSAAGECYSRVALSWQRLGWYDSAMENFRRSLRIFETTQNKKLERRGKINLARFQQYIGDAPAALQTSLDVSIMGKLFSDLPDVYQALEIAADAYHELGEYDLECSTLDQMIGIDSVLYHRGNYTWLMNNKIQAYEAAGRHDLAYADFLTVKNHAMMAGDDTSLARAYYVWGVLQQRGNHPDSALKAFSLAVGSIGRHMDPILQIKILTSLGSLAYRSRHFDNARMYFSDALDVAKKSSIASAEHLLQIMILACDWKVAGSRSAGLVPDFLRRISAMVSYCEQDEYFPGEAFLFFLNARIKENAGDTSGVRTLYSQALEIAFHQRLFSFSEYDEKDLLDAFFDGENSDWTDPVLKYYCTAGDIRSAFDLLQRRRQGNVREYFSRLHITTTNDRLKKEIAEYQHWLSMKQRLQRDINDERALGKNKNSERLHSLLVHMPEDSVRIRIAANAIAKENANFYWLVSEESPVLHQIQDSLRPGTAMVEYIPLYDCTYIIVVEHDTVHLRRSDYSRTRLSGYVRDFLRIISDRKPGDVNVQSADYVASARLDDLSDALGQILLQPIAPLINNLKAITVVPSPEMEWIPVHTLRINGKSLIDQIAVGYLPTAASVLFTQNTDAQVYHVGAVGHPGHTGWDVEYELRDIRSFYDSARVIVGSQATSDAIRNAAYDALHLALEFNLDTYTPDRSAFWVADGRTSYGVARLSLGDAFQIPSSQALIISNLASKPGGMAYYVPLAFLANGVPNVIATMWQGSRREKRYFGEVFYTAMKEGVIPSQAYLEAIHAAEKKNDFSAIYRWGLYYRFGK